MRYTAQFLMAQPLRWEDLQEFNDLETAFKYIVDRRALMGIRYRIVDWDDKVVAELPSDD